MHIDVMLGPGFFSFVPGTTTALGGPEAMHLQLNERMNFVNSEVVLCGNKGISYY